MVVSVSLGAVILVKQYRAFTEVEEMRRTESIGFPFTTLVVTAISVIFTSLASD
jgi:hypothetical protein